jgi:hygromycin-B 4-O-kinase
VLLAEKAPSRQDVVHGDLFNRNVLVSGGNVTAVLDWGCSMYGDHLYDVAWLAFCAPYTSGFDRLSFRRAARRHYADAGIAPDDFDRRVDCYEVHIGLAGMTYQAFVGDHDAARLLAGRTRAVLVEIADRL